jgi:hypothetical protein
MQKLVKIGKNGNIKMRHKGFLVILRKKTDISKNLAYIISCILRKKIEALSCLRWALLRSMVLILSMSMVSLDIELLSLDFYYFIQAILPTLSIVFRFPSALVAFLSK